jgi:membrane-bound lytic murein transglycosylase B
MMKTNKSWLTISLVSGLMTIATPCSAIETTPLSARFIDSMVKIHHFDAANLTSLFKSAKLKKDILQVISKPAEAHTPWYQYQKQFITEQRTHAGVKFWQENQQLLASVSQKYGVPEEIMVAILGIETFYGQDTGRYRVIDALSTLAFFYPKRSKFFLAELEHFLLLCREEKLNPLMPLGSYAGAMGLAQFMPSSVRNYAVDHDKDKRRDMWHNRADILASVGHYLAKYGWQAGQPITYPVTAKTDKYQQALLSNTLIPDFTLAQLQQLTIVLPAKIDVKLRAKLLRFEQEQASELWLGLNNFYVITRYNHSALYAMAVYQLSAAILNQKRTSL